MVREHSGKLNPNYKHGMRGTLTYTCWRNMKNRCSNPNYPQSIYYKKRGITICDRWQDFTNFLADMGQKPENMTLERINNNKGYSPENCVWATKAEQSQNRRTTRLDAQKVEEIRKLYSVGAKTQKELSKKYDVSVPTIADVLKNRTWYTD